MSPARSSTCRCFETAGRLMSNGRATSVTDASPFDSRARIARLVGSASAPKVTLSRSVDEVAGLMYLTYWFNTLREPAVSSGQGRSPIGARAGDVAGGRRDLGPRDGAGERAIDLTQAA